VLLASRKEIYEKANREKEEAESVNGGDEKLDADRGGEIEWGQAGEKRGSKGFGMSW
jgi:hypothetical protein